MIKQADICILMGSKNDWAVMKGALEAINNFGVTSDVKVLSAHRAPALVIDYVRKMEAKGTHIFICGAGGAAHLAGLVAAHTTLPVIGVPVSAGALKGHDALLSTVQMPQGIPVATVAIDGSFNAGILAIQILSFNNKKLKSLLKNFKNSLEKKVIEASKALEKEIKNNN